MGMGKSLQKDVVNSIARVFDRTATRVFERCVQIFEPNIWHLFEA